MHLVQFLLPVRTGGTRIPESRFAVVRRELTDRFGGVTAYMRAPASGLWKNDGGKVDADEVVMVETIVSELDREWWRTYRRTLEAAFEQQEILVRALPIEML